MSKPTPPRAPSSAASWDLARELHDHVLQRLFAVGLQLESMSQSACDDSEQLVAAADALDVAIAELRVAIFALSDEGGDRSARRRVLRAVDDFGRARSALPSLAFAGPLDRVLDGPAEDAVVDMMRRVLVAVSDCTDGTLVRLEAVEGIVDLSVSGHVSETSHMALSALGFAQAGPGSPLVWSLSV